MELNYSITLIILILFVKLCQERYSFLVEQLCLFVHNYVFSNTNDKRVKLYILYCIRNRKQHQRHLAELKQNSPKKGSSLRGSPKKNLPKLLPSKLPPLREFGKLVFCKRIFKSFTEIPTDPLEIQLLYSQAVHYAVQVCK